MYGVIASAGAIIIFSWDGLDLGGRVSYLGLSLVGLSVIISAVQSIVQRFLALEMAATNQPATNIVTYQSLIATIFLVPLIVYYFSTTANATINILPQIMFIGIFGLTHVALAFVLRLNALKYITAQQSVVISYLEPVTSVTLSVLFLREAFNLGYVIGSVLILGAAIAVGLHTVRPNKQTNLSNNF